VGCNVQFSLEARSRWDTPPNNAKGSAVHRIIGSVKYGVLRSSRRKLEPAWAPGISKVVRPGCEKLPCGLSAYRSSRMNRNHLQGKPTATHEKSFLGAKLMRCESILHPAPKDRCQSTGFWLKGVALTLETYNECLVSFFRARLDLIAHFRNQQCDSLNRLLDIGIKSASGRLLNPSYPARSAFRR